MKPPKSNRANDIAATMVVLGSAYLLPSPLHAALYIVGSGVMLYTQVIPKLRHKIAQKTKPICKSYPIINQNLVSLSYSLPSCALSYATSALFTQPLYEFLIPKIGETSADLFIMAGPLHIIPQVGLNYLNGNTALLVHPAIKNQYTDTYIPRHIALQALLVGLYYATGFDKIYGKASAGLCCLLLLYTWKFCPRKQDKKAAIMYHLPHIATIALTHSAIDILSIAQPTPLVGFGAMHLNTTITIATESIVDRVL